MILESIVTSENCVGDVNIAPMGPEVSESFGREDPVGQLLLLKPFVTSTTFNNLRQTGVCVVHITDDVGLIARTALDCLKTNASLTDVLQEDLRFHVLRDCHRWFGVEVESVDDSSIRAELVCRVVRTDIVRPFFGFNRAKHAVLEATILATRTHLIEQHEIDRQMVPLQNMVDKTGGRTEREAMTLVRGVIASRYMELSS